MNFDKHNLDRIEVCEILPEQIELATSWRRNGSEKSR